MLYPTKLRAHRLRLSLSPSMFRYLLGRTAGIIVASGGVAQAATTSDILRRRPTNGTLRGRTAARAELTASEADAVTNKSFVRWAAFGCIKGAIWGRQIGNPG